MNSVTIIYYRMKEWKTIQWFWAMKDRFGNSNIDWQQKDFAAQFEVAIIILRSNVTDELILFHFDRNQDCYVSIISTILHEYIFLSHKLELI